MTTCVDHADITRLAAALGEAFPEMKLTEAAPMSRYTTLRLGGPADLLAEPYDAASLAGTLRMAGEYGVPVTVIGQGSNLLVLDGGIRGLVVRVGREMREVTVAGDTVIASGGLSMAALAQAAAEHGLAGLAFASGIPGTVGGGVYMNAGAYGSEMCQVVTAVECVRMDGTMVTYSTEEMAFGYRTSRLHHEDSVVSRVHFRLTPGDREAILAEMADLNRRRAEKQPLNLPSAGSTFKRPEGYFAAALIDECGLKGCSIGGAQVSEKHAGFCVNRGGTAADFMALIAHVQKTVLEQKGVVIETEVKILGEAVPAAEV